MKKQKQPSRGVLRKRCSENMQQIYRKTTMLKCGFNNVAATLFIFLYFILFFLNIKWPLECKKYGRVLSRPWSK